MDGSERDKPISKDALPVGQASSQREEDEHDAAAIQDISTILQGAKATTGRAVTSAGRMTVNADSAAHQLATTRQKERDAQEARELAHLATWNKQKTVVSGVEMTNEQAQNARQRFIDNEDQYADRAAQLGYIKTEEKEQLKRGMRRKTELEDKEGRGTITEAERKERSEFDRSRLGQAADKITADLHQGQGVAARAESEAPSVDSAVARGRAPSAARSDDLFQSAPKIRADFADANTPPVPSEANPTPSAPAPVSREVKATGLDI